MEHILLQSYPSEDAKAFCVKMDKIMAQRLLQLMADVNRLSLGVELLDGLILRGGDLVSVLTSLPKATQEQLDAEKTVHRNSRIDEEDISASYALKANVYQNRVVFTGDAIFFPSISSVTLYDEDIEQYLITADD